MLGFASNVHNCTAIKASNRLGKAVPHASRRTKTALPVLPFSRISAPQRGPRPVQFVVKDRTPAMTEAVEKAYKRLQNGSDIRGVAITGVEGEAVSLTPASCYFIGRAFATWVAAQKSTPVASLRISVGRDPRVSGPMLGASLMAGIVSTGAAVDDFGLATTPAMFYSTVAPGYEYDAGIMMTASHLPFNRNGLKFFTVEGGLEKKDIKAVLDTAIQDSAEHSVVPSNGYADFGFVIQKSLETNPDAISKVDFMPVYAASLREIIKAEVNSSEDYNKPLKGFKIIVDAGNGSGGFFATSVLAPLGADTAGSQFLEPDGTFPNHIPNPEHPSAMKATIEAVNRAGADLGIVFDTDVDRSGVVDGNGKPINSNRMIAVMAAIALRQYPGTTIVTDSVTSNGLTTFIQDLGGKHYRYKRGYKNVIGKGVELNQQGVSCELMMETSGHGAMKENRFLDDGAYSAVKILIEMVRRQRAGEGGIGSLLAGLPEPVEAVEHRIKVLEPEFNPVQDDVLSAFHDWVVEMGAESGWNMAEVNYEGWRVEVDQGEGRKGWLLLRASLHDPLIVLNVESDVPGGNAAILEKLSTFFSANSFAVDTSALFK